MAAECRAKPGLRLSAPRQTLRFKPSCPAKNNARNWFPTSDNQPKLPELRGGPDILHSSNSCHSWCQQNSEFRTQKVLSAQRTVTDFVPKLTTKNP